MANFVNSVSGAISVNGLDKVVHQINMDMMNNSVPDFTIILSRAGKISVNPVPDMRTSVDGKDVASYSVSIGLNFLATETPDNILKEIIKAMGKVRELSGGEKMDKVDNSLIFNKAIKGGINNMISKQSRKLDVIKREIAEKEKKASESKAEKASKAEKISAKLREFKLSDRQIAEIMEIVNGKAKKA